MTETGQKSLPISLRPWSPEDTDKSNDLRENIGRINAQRNGFRNVSENQILAEMDNGKDDESSVIDSDGGGVSEDEDEKGTMKAIQKRREEMHRALFQAREESLFALDSYSLSTTAVLPNQGKSTMSPDLVNTVSTGSFGIEKWQNMRKDPRKVEIENHVWKGSFMTNLTDSTDALLAAATRLEKQVKSETEYWRELLSLTTNGWPVYKPQRANAPMEVQFGATEAGVEFKANGVAALRPNDDGTIMLDRRLGGEPKTLRLRLADNGTVISSSVTATLLSLVDLGSSLEDKVRRAQSSLFEEELFQEMVLESRILQPLGIRLYDNVLHLPFSSFRHQDDKREHLLDLVSLDEASELNITGSGDEKMLLDAQSILLRLLLCHVYHLRAQKRSQIPPPLSETQRIEPPSSTIRYFYALSQHYNAYQLFSAYLSALEKISSSAGLPITFKTSGTPALHALLQSLESTRPKSKTDSSLHLILQGLGRAQRTSATIEMHSTDEGSAATMTLSLITNLSPPLLGSEIVAEMPQNIAQLIYGPETLDRKVTFANLSELKEYMSSLLSMHISTHVLLARSKGWEASDNQPMLYKSYTHGGNEARVSVAVKVSKDDIELRRRRVPDSRIVDSEIWAAEGTNDRSIIEVFDSWMEDN